MECWSIGGWNIDPTQIKLSNPISSPSRDCVAIALRVGHKGRWSFFESYRTPGSPYEGPVFLLGSSVTVVYLESYPIAGIAGAVSFSISVEIPTIVIIRLRSKHVASNEVSA